jgi:hypothetical protein
MTTMNKKPTRCTLVLNSLKLYCILIRQTKAGRYNQPNDTRWQEAVCAELGGSWWWAQECPKLVERNKNTISFNDFKTIVHLVGFLFIVVIAEARNHEPEVEHVMLLCHWSVHASNINTIKSLPLHYAYFHSIIKFGTIMWGNSSNTAKIFA